MNWYLAFGPPVTVASKGMLAFMILFALVLLPFYPWILRRRRKRAQEKAHEEVEKARAEILEDGKVEGPKGPYVPHKPWDVGGTGKTPKDGPPRANAYHGGPWP